MCHNGQGIEPSWLVLYTHYTNIYIYYSRTYDAVAAIVSNIIIRRISMLNAVFTSIKLLGSFELYHHANV